MSGGWMAPRSSSQLKYPNYLTNDPQLLIALLAVMRALKTRGIPV